MWFASLRDRFAEIMVAWTAEHRRAADRRGLRYPSDLTNAEWALVQPMIRPAKRGGRPGRLTCVRC